MESIFRYQIWDLFKIDSTHLKIQDQTQQDARAVGDSLPQILSPTRR